MMISPESFTEQFIDRPIGELREKRDELIAEIRRFEEDPNGGLPENMMVAPSPDVFYQLNNDYLCEIVKLKNWKFNAMVNGGSEDDRP